MQLFSSFPALINGLSQIPPHQKKRVYLCQLLIRVAQGKNLGKYSGSFFHLFKNCCMNFYRGVLDMLSQSL